MANIGRLPTAADLVAGTERRGAYGDRLTWQRVGEDTVQLLAPDDTVLAQAKGQTVNVSLAKLDPLVVPYVNAFVAHTSARVEKYWRTKRYRIVDVDDSAATEASLEPAIDIDIAALLTPANGRSEVAYFRTMAAIFTRAADALEAAGAVAVVDGDA